MERCDSTTRVLGGTPPDRSRGSSSLELAIILPVVLLVVFGAIQLAIWHHADNTARAAASSCAERARGYDHTTRDGITAGEQLLSQVRGLDNPTVQAYGDGREVRCVVTGEAPLLIAIGDREISQTATLPKERV